MVIWQVKNQTLDSCSLELGKINYFSLIGLFNCFLFLYGLFLDCGNSCMCYNTHSLTQLSEARGKQREQMNDNQLSVHTIPQRLCLAKVLSPWWKHVCEIPRWYPTTVIIVTCLFIFPLRNWMSKKKNHN